MEKFCTNCGAPLEVDVSFCANCGAKVSEPAQPVMVAAQPADFAAFEQTSAPQETIAEPELVIAEEPEPVKPEPVVSTARPQPQVKPKGGKYGVMGTGAFFGLMLLFAIPIVGFICSIVLSFAPQNENFKHYARAALIWKIIGIVLLILLVLLFVFIFENFGGYMGGIGDMGDIGDIIGNADRIENSMASPDINAAISHF